MTSQEIRKKFLEFFKRHDHTAVSSSSLMPTDPSVLFTTAGMQQFKKYYTGEADAMADFGSKSTTSVQKCVRTSDIDEVGDERHLTFFEMLGNFSFGGYFKKEAIGYAYEFITNVMNLKIDYVTVFEGEPFDEAQGKPGVPADTESEEIWRSLDANIVVKKFGRADNFWGPTGEEGPCGPTTEIYVDGIEIWNVVFNQYYQQKDKILEPLKTPGIDTGMGLERLALVSQFPGETGNKTVFDTDLFNFASFLPSVFTDRVKRILADHARTVVFMICDGILPSNKDQGYVLRRLLRRMMVHYFLANYAVHEAIKEKIVNYEDILEWAVKQYRSTYTNLDFTKVKIVVTEEYTKFSKTLESGLRELNKLEIVDGRVAFRLFESFGLPYEAIKELSGKKADTLDWITFEKEFKEHQEKSRAGQEKKFGGHGLLLDTGELKAANEEELKKVTRLHTATHMLQQALREVLGPEVHQAGSDITAERLRFDFSFPRKMNMEEIAKVEDTVNQKIQEDLPMQKVELPKEEAEQTGALYFFKEKYPDRVNVYFIGPDLAHAWSKEFCGGPHVTHTGEIGKFKITKEEAVAAGVRRIRAIVE